MMLQRGMIPQSWIPQWNHTMRSTLPFDKRDRLIIHKGDDYSQASSGSKSLPRLALGLQFCSYLTHLSDLTVISDSWMLAQPVER